MTGGRGGGNSPIEILWTKSGWSGTEKGEREFIVMDSMFSYSIVHTKYSPGRRGEGGDMIVA